MPTIQCPQTGKFILQLGMYISDKGYWRYSGGEHRALALQDGRQHPTQKPVALMKWCIGKMGEVCSILDPYMGSGTTLVAAKSFGISAMGVEREEKYCEIAAKRLAQEVLFA